MTQPAPDRESARAHIAAHFTSGIVADDLLDRHAAEVRTTALREAADAIDARQAKLDAEIRAEYGELDRDTELEGAATRSMAAHLRRMAEEARS